MQDRRAGAIGLLISGVILLILILITRGISNETWVWVLIGVALCIAGLIYWWHHGLAKLYRKRIKERNAREYEGIIDEKNRQLQQLRDDNEAMAKLIHRDNKILRAMRESVRLSLLGDIDKSKQLLVRLDSLMVERDSIISQGQQENKILLTTKDVVIDGIIELMMLKASENGIQFDIAVVGDISELTETIISDIKFETLFADLIENAIIATSYSEHKQILITFGFHEGFYELSVHDSGIPFEIDTLLNLGKKKSSTHLNEGGSGIGYMTIFEILRECKASLVIAEFEPKPRAFTKSISVRFDDKDEYIVTSYRASEIHRDAGASDTGVIIYGDVD